MPTISVEQFNKEQKKGRRREETDLVGACLQWLHMMGVVAWRTNTGAMTGEHNGRRRFVKFGTKGMSDIIGVLPGGRALFVECKTAKGVQSAAQFAFQLEVQKNGAAYVLVRDLDDLSSELVSRQAWNQ